MWRVPYIPLLIDITNVAFVPNHSKYDIWDQKQVLLEVSSGFQCSWTLLINIVIEGAWFGERCVESIIKYDCS